MLSLGMEEIMPRGIHMKTQEHRKRISELHLKHGDNRIGKTTKLYSVWSLMKSRCCCENNTRYKNYGGRGIMVCKEWMNDYDIFKKWALKSGYKVGRVIHRLDNDKGYEPSNCIFWDKTEHDKLNIPPHILKISDEQIRDILLMKNNKKQIKQIAQTYSISESNVRNILKGIGCPRYNRLYREVICQNG